MCPLDLHLFTPRFRHVSEHSSLTGIRGYALVFSISGYSYTLRYDTGVDEKRSQTYTTSADGISGVDTGPGGSAFSFTGGR